MTTVMWVAMGVLLGIISPVLLLQMQRRRAAAESGKPPRLSRKESERPRNPFAAVSIRPCAQSPCAAVRQMHHRRFLAVRAPSLPVAGCDQKKCGCRYIRHSDRRTPSERAPVSQVRRFLPTKRPRSAAGTYRRESLIVRCLVALSSPARYLLSVSRSCSGVGAIRPLLRSADLLVWCAGMTLGDVRLASSRQSDIQHTDRPICSP